MTTEENYWYSRASQDVLYSERQHESIMSSLIQREEYNLFSLLKPKLSLDGDLWCVLLGDNMQEGVVAFGESPYLAILDFNKQMTMPNTLKNMD